MCINQVFCQERSFLMKEILAYGLQSLFINTDLSCRCTYKGKRYEVWEIPDKDFKTMSDMTDEEFEDVCPDGWWRYSDGSVLGKPKANVCINGEYLVGWDDDYYLPDEYEDEPIKHFESLSDYLCDCVGASTEKNVCACAVDLAKYNNMTMAELFKTYGE